MHSSTKLSSPEKPIDTNPAKPLSQVGLWNSRFFQSRREPSFGRFEIITLVLYSAIVAATVPFHEPWADEAQAWLIARDSSLWDLFYRRLHYEGTPGLWHLMLWFAARLHLPYVSVNWIAALCAIAGVYVWLRYCPLPPVVRYLTPFTYWLQYQYSVIARGYALIPFFAFCLCALFYRKRPRALLFAIAAGLMANLSLYSFLWAGCLVVFYIPVVLRWRKEHSDALHLRWAGVLVCGLFLFAFYTASPAPDLVHRSDGASHFIHPSPIRDKLIPPTPAPHFPVTSLTVQPLMKFDVPPEGIDTTLYSRGNPFQRLFIKILYPQTQSYRAQTLGHRLRILIVPINALFYALSSSNLLGGAILLLSLMWLFSKRALRFALPLLLMLLFGGVTNINDHHAGLLFLALVCALWLADRQPSSKGANSLLGHPLMLALAAMLIEQVAWSASAVVSDIRYPFDPGKETAQFLKQNAVGNRVMALQYETVSAVPFLKGLPFENQPTTYWMYSEKFPYGKRFVIDIGTRPDIFIIGVQYAGDKTMGNQLVPVVPEYHSHYAIDPRTMQSAGYRERTRFCGRMFMHGGTATIYCNIVYIPTSAARAGSD